MKKFIENLPGQAFWFLLFAAFWGAAFTVLELADNTPGTIDSIADYIAIVLFLAPLLYAFYRMVTDPFKKR